MKKAFTIHQLPTEHRNAFMNYDWAIRHGGVAFEDYRLVHAGRVDKEDAIEMLERIYTVFNTIHPTDYQGRSISVSDIVCIEGEGQYFCDSIGWKKID